jgi:tetratricopeptide (TPR) repeat protein
MKRILPVLFVVVATAQAFAQTPTPTPPPPPGGKPDVAALEAKASKHYQLAEYDQAITDFKEAYRLSENPDFLFNIAQAYRLKNDCREASTFYKNYLRNAPNPPNAAKVRERIAEMDACAATQPQPAPTTTTATTTTTTAQTQQDQQVDQPEEPTTAPNNRAWMKWAGIGGMAVGAIGVGLGIKFGLDGSAANDDLAEKCKVSCTSAEALAIESDGKAANRNAMIFGVAGGAVLAGGVVLFVLSMQGGQTATEPSASLQFTRGGATASYAWRF